MFIKTSLRFLAAGASAALLAGCLTNSKDDPAPTGRIRAGLPIDSVMGAKAAVLVGKTLYVGNRDSVAVGVVGIDIETDAIVSFFPEKLAPNEMAVVEDSLV